MLNLDDVTELEDASVFKIKQHGKFPAETSTEFYVYGISLDVNLDQTVVSRSGYTFLDVLSDVGGLESIIISFMAIFLSIINFNNLDNHMVTHLFQLSSKSPEKVDNFSLKDVNGIKEYIQNTFCSKIFFCCKRNRRQEKFMKAREALSDETDIM